MQLGAASSYKSKTYVAQTVESISGAEGSFPALSGGLGGFSDSLKSMVTQPKEASSTRISSIAERLEAVRNMRARSLDYLLELLFGKQSSMRSPDLATETDFSLSQSSSFTYQTTRYTTYFTHQEDESMSFSAKGKVQTTDGRSIDFSMNLTLSRSFTEQTSSFIDYTQPVLCDPLVINLDTPSANVTDQTFFFDLDCDGTEEEISVLDATSGYLALDKNGDGMINDGSELFGTTNGNGFYDLMQYDHDKNGWIDEADEIFDKLKIWVMQEDGSSKLLGLKEAGVGALYLGSAAADFSLKNKANITNAIVRATGMFLYEDGKTGTMQQLDLAT